MPHIGLYLISLHFVTPTRGLSAPFTTIQDHPSTVLHAYMADQSSKGLMHTDCCPRSATMSYPSQQSGPIGEKYIDQYASGDSGRVTSLLLKCRTYSTGRERGLHERGLHSVLTGLPVASQYSSVIQSKLLFRYQRSNYQSSRLLNRQLLISSSHISHILLQGPSLKRHVN